MEIIKKLSDYAAMGRLRIRDLLLKFHPNLYLSRNRYANPLMGRPQHPLGYPDLNS